MRKLWSTIRICATIIVARHFGQYVHSGWDGEHSYARYRWRGRDVFIPTLQDY